MVAAGAVVADHELEAGLVVELAPGKHVAEPRRDVEAGIAGARPVVIVTAGSEGEHEGEGGELAHWSLLVDAVERVGAKHVRVANIPAELPVGPVT